MVDLSEQSELMHAWLSYFSAMQRENPYMPISPKAIQETFVKSSQAIFNDPSFFIEVQKDLLKDINEFYQNLYGIKKTEDSLPVQDKRFQHEAWSKDPYFIFLKEYYLTTSKWLREITSHVQGLDPDSKMKLEFYVNQYIDATCPTNFPMTNPDVIEEFMKTGGTSLEKGLKALKEDLATGHWMKMTDSTPFKLGSTLATTKGDVIFRNEIIELIHYAPLTDKQYSVPLLIIPPWINKYYIFDLSPHNSFVKWILEQGYNVFMISWVNPDRSLASKNFEDYLFEGAYKAGEEVVKYTGSPKINAMGYCIGGNLLTALGAYLAKKPAPFSLESMTLIATIIDFTKIGELKVFLDDENLEYIEHNLEQTGFVDPERLKSIFSMLRPKDLLWSFFIKNYLLGQVPPPFDFLYWNADATRVPQALHKDVLYKCFRDNLFMTPGGWQIKNVPVNMQNIKTPTFFLSTIEDHIAPWKSTYPAVHQFKGPLEFVLAGSGHVVGVMNHPDRKKYGFFSNTKLPSTPEEWLEAAQKNEGSWWPYWGAWLKLLSGEKIKPKSGKSLGPAPGNYVKEE